MYGITIRGGSVVLAAFAFFIGILMIVAHIASASATTTSTETATSTTAVQQSTSTSATTTSPAPSTSVAASSSPSLAGSVAINTQLPNPLLPVISGIAATSSATSTIVSWQTSNQVSTGAVLYGTTTDYTATSTSDLALNHAVTLFGLEPDTTYHFAISATTGAGTATSPDQTFTTPSAAPVPSGTPPVISMVTVVPTYSIATISWTTDQTASSEVFYGPTSLYTASSTGDSQLAQIPTMNHVVTISNLSPDTTYHFAVVSENSSGLTATSSDMMFTTGSP